MQGNFKVFKMIASHVDNINVKTFKSGDTPLHLAVLEGNMEIVEYLYNIDCLMTHQILKIYF